MTRRLLICRTLMTAAICIAPFGCSGNGNPTTQPDAGRLTAPDSGSDAGSQGIPDSGTSDAGAPDAGALDAGNITAVYNDMGDSTLWSTFDATTVRTESQGFMGAAFDGRYAYFVPNANISNSTATVDGVVTRYDTTSDFALTGSWSTFDATTVDTGAKGFAGAVFDGRYLYFVPLTNGSIDGVVARYDTQASFTDAASWASFDTTGLNANAKGFCGGTFDGRYVYFVPGLAVSTGVVTRFDTHGSFSDPASWSTFDTTTVDTSARAFNGAVFDGRYVYLVPSNPSGLNLHTVARYDTQATFDSAGSWSMFDTTQVDPGAGGFMGAAFDGRYVYLVPNDNNAGYDGLVARFDTTASFQDAASWSSFDATTVDPLAKGFQGAAFDGRYLYLVPFFNSSAFSGLVARYDTQATFADARSWSTFDTTSVDATASGFFGGVFDGRYLYLAPNRDGTIARFDAKTPPSMPSLPAWNGSFY